MRVCVMHLQNGEEIQGLQKRIGQLETDVEQAKSSLTEATDKLEKQNAQLTNVTHYKSTYHCSATCYTSSGSLSIVVV